ncbi:putative protein kinase RLK-Pelle-DLSV family [Helianthus annuus]|uniref:Putative gnk2-like domain-containing protein n=1 Tax=Helianthus annuus TaxID=4232 RepID=A0A251UB85_HELAN|nr:cold-responsive protein kinase 1 isoform X1 [Helianthus annuus]KAF5798583.1 putative protein kinase RLK-Pelle-DLSV family [Helianthus annuus]KAJ0550161.1 putative protein kinase RLK-Pelle-DLSV family [Helianthus annuus]KAJ0556784.1 putative protein kinase RLK-Pelle-DLSV family [Helianthus annuus]KAJ0563117.1 putative protein kinase RLK-Pelle-DLSV family [Helianthus annuus]KAJ0728484.1 putative protein kinase RLK-Pelle-DLSV family [Helianthus annuus]
MAVVLLVLLVLLLTEPGFSQTDNHDNDTNDRIGFFCGRNAVTSLPNFAKNRNATLNDLRMQLLSNRVVYAKAQALSAGDPVFAAAQCRNYLSVDRCVACFDAGVSELTNCSAANGYVIFDNCFIRYEDFDEFYTDPYFMMDGTGSQYLSCGNNQSTSRPTFNQGVDGLLSNIKDATPKTSNYYVASITQVTSENATVYATAQCIANINQTICQTCMNAAYDKLTTCLPSTQGRFSDMACFVRYSELPFFDDNQTTDITTVLKGHSRKLVAIVAAAVGGVVLFFLILVLWLFYRRKKSKKTAQGPSDLNGAVYYDYKDLKLATDNFSQANVLGKGGFGEVFKAILDDKNIVAVKRIQVQHAGGKEEFENEVKLISNIQHRNLLRLLGWSSQGSHLLLVLEYMPNGSLDRFLWGAQRGTLDWNQRYEIILGIARGLAHLHDEFHFKIVHRDIKSSNILLGDDFRPKIADFGLARFQPEGQSHVSTRFAGTLGYTAPEYALQGILSDKVDTYSFGIVILEIISGRRSTELRPYGSSTCYLLEDAWEMYENTKHINVIDETLNLNKYEHEHVTKIIEIALLCTSSPASDRPIMSEVVSMLQEGKSSGKIQLTRPTFLRYEDRRIRISHANPKDMDTTQELQTDTEMTN